MLLKFNTFRLIKTYEKSHVMNYIVKSLKGTVIMAIFLCYRNLIKE